MKNPRPLSGIHVLVVDDNTDARSVFKTVLNFLGALTTTRASASSALAVMTLVTPDVVLTDLTMPLRDGRWLLDQIRASDRGIPVVAVTANKYADLSAFDGGVYKPVDLEQLTDVILDAVLPRRKPTKRPRELN